MGTLDLIIIIVKGEITIKGINRQDRLKRQNASMIIRLKLKQAKIEHVEGKSRRANIQKVGDLEENKDQALPFEEMMELNFLQ